MRSACLGIALALAPAVARADTQEDQAAARALFTEARALMQAGKHEAACPKLEAARRLYAGSGVLLNLGDCYEHLGRTASAFQAFVEAGVAAARLNRPDDEAEAKRRRAQLEPTLPRIIVRVARAAPSETVKRDGVLVEPAVWGAALAADPGAYTFTAEAPDRRPKTVTVQLAAAQTVTLEIPELAPLVTPTPTPGPYFTARRVIGLATLGAGAAAMGVSFGVALDAKGRYDAALVEAGARRHDDSVSAVAQANVATGLFVAGAAIAALGLVVWLTAPSAPPEAPALSLSIGPGTLWARGAF